MKSVQANEYFAQLRNIQNCQFSQLIETSQDEPFFDIYLDGNDQFKLPSRSIRIPPEYQTFMGVEKDHRAEMIYFRVDRYYDDVDLLKTTIIIEYINAKGESHIYPIVQKDWVTEPGKIIFSWCIGADATCAPGILSFAVKFYSIDQAENKFTYNLNTLEAQGKILPAIDVKEIDKDFDLTASQYEQVLDKIEKSQIQWIDV